MAWPGGTPTAPSSTSAAPTARVKLRGFLVERGRRDQGGHREARLRAALMDQGNHDAHHQSKRSKLELRAQPAYLIASQE
ncbi:hypothetical protein JKV81_15135 [Streptomyces sp. For3]|uniref:hypothetical protein n=1 Tax=Streptomyces silvae TaxID=2803812 RepID=UPI0019246BD8|nr:hypothetical protein [Streptomyces silvae]MBL1288159.1 hypothetical protein [Streptomyces silvae]